MQRDIILCGKSSEWREKSQIFCPCGLLFPRSTVLFSCYCSLTYFTTEISCNGLCNPENGRVSISSGAAGLVANYTCNKGYDGQGSSKRKCCNGSWTGAEPQCTG